VPAIETLFPGIMDKVLATNAELVTTVRYLLSLKACAAKADVDPVSMAIRSPSLIKSNSERAIAIFAALFWLILDINGGSIGERFDTKAPWTFAISPRSTRGRTTRRMVWSDTLKVRASSSTVILPCMFTISRICISYFDMKPLVSGYNLIDYQGKSPEINKNQQKH
jgi:hypothetical protein